MLQNCCSKTLSKLQQNLQHGPCCRICCIVCLQKEQHFCNRVIQESFFLLNRATQVYLLFVTAKTQAAFFAFFAFFLRTTVNTTNPVSATQLTAAPAFNPGVSYLSSML